MGRKNFNSFLKKKRAEDKRKKKMEKRERLEERKNEDSSGKLEDMIAYVNDDGEIVSNPPDDEE